MMANQKSTENKSNAQIAYEDDVRSKPFYHDGTPRCGWDDLPPFVKKSWEEHPTPRDCRIFNIFPAKYKGN